MSQSCSAMRGRRRCHEAEGSGGNSHENLRKGVCIAWLDETAVKGFKEEYTQRDGGNSHENLWKGVCTSIIVFTRGIYMKGHKGLYTQMDGGNRNFHLQLLTSVEASLNVTQC